MNERQSTVTMPLAEYWRLKRLPQNDEIEEKHMTVIKDCDCSHYPGESAKGEELDDVAYLGGTGNVYAKNYFCPECGKPHKVIDRDGRLVLRG